MCVRQDQGRIALLFIKPLNIGSVPLLISSFTDKFLMAFESKCVLSGFTKGIPKSTTIRVDCVQISTHEPPISFCAPVNLKFHHYQAVRPFLIV